MFTSRLHKGPPPTLQIFFHGVLVAELRKNKVPGGRSEYSFKYLPAFKEQRLAALPGIPYREEEHVRSELWPYFAERIPDIRRPEIRALMKVNRLSEYDDIALLARLGAHSITDPYEIRYAA